MSNFKPHSVGVWNDRIKDGVLRLMRRRIAEVNAKFPLTREEVQRAVVEQRALELLNELKVIHLMDNLPRYEKVWFTLPLTPEVPRQAVICCRCHQIGSLYMTVEQPDYYKDNTPLTVLNLNDLSEARKTQLYNWVNLAVTECRHRALVTGTVTTFLRRYADTLWHVMVRWPVLKLGFDDDTRERAHTAPRNSAQYGWNDYGGSGEWYYKNREVMQFIDRLLLEASMLPAAWEILPGLRASIQTWKKLGDEMW